MEGKNRNAKENNIILVGFKASQLQHQYVLRIFHPQNRNDSILLRRRLYIIIHQNKNAVVQSAAHLTTTTHTLQFPSEWLLAGLLPNWVTRRRDKECGENEKER